MKFIVLATIYASIVAAAFLIAGHERDNNSAGLYRDGTLVSYSSEAAEDGHGPCEDTASLLKASGQGGTSRCR